MKTKTLFILIQLVMLLTACQQIEPTPAETADRLLEPTSTLMETSPTLQPAAAALIDYEPIFESADCPFRLPAGQIEGETVECGYLIVPENRFDPESRDIRLAVGVFHPSQGTTESDPVLYLSGGPGGSPPPVRIDPRQRLDGDNLRRHHHETRDEGQQIDDHAACPRLAAGDSSASRLTASPRASCG